MTDQKDIGPAFYSSSPGQDLDDLVVNLTQDDMIEILGYEIYKLVQATSRDEDMMSALRDVTGRILRHRADELIINRKVRSILLSAMSTKKVEELAKRLGLSKASDLNTLSNKDLTHNRDFFLSFFGIDTRTLISNTPEVDREMIAPSFSLFPHQRVAAARVIEVLKRNRGKVVLHMPTGSGKTRTAMHIMSYFLSSDEPLIVVWLASSVELLEQAAEAFEIAWRHLGNRPVEMIRFWGGHNPNLSDLKDAVVVAGIQKLRSFKAGSAVDFLRFAKTTRLVIVDEAHQAIAPTYQDTINSLIETGNYSSLLGLSATPGRTWSDIDADEQLADFFDHNKVILQMPGWDDPVSYLISNGYLAKPVFTKIEFSSTSEETINTLSNETQNSDDYSKECMEALSHEVERNIVLINEVNRLIKNGHSRIILFSASVHHAEILSALINANGVDSYVVTGETPTAIRSRSLKRYKSVKNKAPVVLCNYGVLTTGFDAPATSAAIIARPTRSLVLFSQMVGRAMRGINAGGNETCEISTVVDIHLPGFGDVADAFLNWEDVWNV